MQDRDKKQPDPSRGARWTRFSRTAAFWVLIILIPLLIVHVFNTPREQQAELPYTTYTEQLAGGNVAEVTIIDGGQASACSDALGFDPVRGARISGGLALALSLPIAAGGGLLLRKGVRIRRDWQRQRARMMSSRR